MEALLQSYFVVAIFGIQCGTLLNSGMVFLLTLFGGISLVCFCLSIVVFMIASFSYYTCSLYSGRFVFFCNWAGRLHKRGRRGTLVHEQVQ